MPAPPSQTGLECAAPAGAIALDGAGPAEPDERTVAPHSGSPRPLAALKVVMSSTLLSRVLGMIRDMATAALFGIGPIADAFTFAFRIPNLARRLFGEGALSAAFLPVFTRVLEGSPSGAQKTEQGQSGLTSDNTLQAWQLASAVFALLAVFLVALVLAGELALWIWSASLGDGLPSRALLIGLTATMLPYAILICLAAQVTAVLHALGHFTWPALVPVVLNVCLIAGIYLVAPAFHPHRDQQAYVLAGCVLLAGVLQLLLQVPTLLRLGFRFRLNWRGVWPSVTEILRSMAPVVFGLSITQINTLLDSVIALWFSQPDPETLFMPLPGHPAYPLQAGAVSALYYGERIYQFPLGVFGVALGTVLFPLLSRHASRREFDRLRDDLALGLRLVIAIGIPASIGLMLVAQPLTRVLFERGEFTAADGSRTAAMIATYGIGVWAFCAIPMLYRGFYALGDRITPMRIGLIAVGLDIALNLTLIWPLAERGLACSTSISAAAQALLLAWLIQRHVGRFDGRHLWRTLWKTGLCTAVMAAVFLATAAWSPSADWLTQFATSTLGLTTLPARSALELQRIGALLIPLTVSSAAYFAAARVVELDELRLLWRSGSKRNQGE